MDASYTICFCQDHYSENFTSGGQSRGRKLGQKFAEWYSLVALANRWRHKIQSQGKGDAASEVQVLIAEIDKGASWPHPTYMSVFEGWNGWKNSLQLIIRAKGHN